MSFATLFNSFLTKAYNAVGLKIVNDAAKNVPAVRYAGAVLIFAMLGAVALFLFQGNLPLLVVTIVCFLVLGLLLVVLGAASTQLPPGLAKFICWVIAAAFSIAIAMVILGFASSFLFQWPRPIGELLQIGDSLLSLDGVTVDLEPDSAGNVVLTAKGCPRQPYSLDVDFVDPTSTKSIASLKLPVPRIEDSQDPSGMVKLNKPQEPVNIVLNLKNGNKTVKSRTISTHLP
jgi:hypothetical protein